MPSRLRDTLVTALTPTSWGTTYIVTTELLPHDRPFLAAMLRALPAGLALLLFARVLPRGAWWWKAALLGALNIGAFFALLFVSAERLPGGVAATLGAIGPIIVTLLSWPVLGLRPAVRGLLAGVVGLAGVALLVLTPRASLDAVGVLAGLGAAVSMAAGIVLTKRWGRPVPLLAFTGWQLSVGGLMLVPLVLAAEGLPSSVTAGQAGGFAYLAFGNTALAYVLWFRGIERLPASAVSFLALLSPIVATLLGYLVLDQSLSALQLGGMLLAALGLVGGQLVAARPRVRPAAVASAVAVLLAAGALAVPALAAGPAKPAPLPAWSPGLSWHVLPVPRTALVHSRQLGTANDTVDDTKRIAFTDVNGNRQEEHVARWRTIDLSRWLPADAKAVTLAIKTIITKPSETGTADIYVLVRAPGARCCLGPPGARDRPVDFSIAGNPDHEGIAAQSVLYQLGGVREFSTVQLAVRNRRIELAWGYQKRPTDAIAFAVYLEAYGS